MSIEKEEFQEKLLLWYKSGHRILPWRDNPTAYHVWISEIMLQQTRVEAVKPYYKRFMDALPTVYDLKEIPDEKLLKLWEGLGYYSRARNLKKAACKIVEEYDGKIPDTYEELVSLPGIGDYTAGAILSIAYQKPYPALDGNVFRVLTRVFANPVDILSTQGKKEIRDLLLSILPTSDNSSFTQALMELGAVVCIPSGEPHCYECPLKHMCIAHQNHQELLYPVKSAKKKRKIETRYVFLITCNHKVLLRKRPETGLLANFYEFPNELVEETTDVMDEILKPFSIHPKKIEELRSCKHIFTHIEWHMIGYHIEVEKETDGIWATLEELEHIYPLPNAFIKYKQVLENILGKSTK